MNLTALPAFADNYIWMLHDGHGAVVVDPGDAAPVHAKLDELALDLAAILVTHHHPDHVGGIDALRGRLSGPVYGPARERIPPPYTALADGDVVEVLGLRFGVIDVPGHTAGHIAYQQLPPGGQALFPHEVTRAVKHFRKPGARLFEGTPAQMAASLARLSALPGDSRVCCTHEYTLANLRFAHAVEPGNAALAAYTVRCQALRDAGLPTLPSSVAQERAVNPFLRCDEPEVRAAARAHDAAADDAVSVFATLREWKNNYR
jgi:hydroxyacylglutathione hydrolase